jgi:hypothetical protein
MKLDLLHRTITAVALVSLAITLGVWLTRAPLAATPAAAPVKITPEPILAPPPPVRPAMMPTVLEVPIEVEIADLAAGPPAAKQAEPKSESRPQCQPRRRGLFRRR